MFQRFDHIYPCNLNNEAALIIPSGLHSLIKDIARKVIQYQPEHTINFIANILEGQLKARSFYRDVREIVEEIVDVAAEGCNLIYEKYGIDEITAQLSARKIQAVFRGYLVRKKLSISRTSSVKPDYIYGEISKKSESEICLKLYEHPHSETQSFLYDYSHYSLFPRQSNQFTFSQDASSKLLISTKSTVSLPTIPSLASGNLDEVDSETQINENEDEDLKRESQVNIVPFPENLDINNFKINTSELKTRASVLNEEDENKIDFSAIEQDDNVNNFEINTSELKTRASVLNEEDENKIDISAIEQDNVNNFEINTSELKTRTSVLNEEDENKIDFSAIEQDDNVNNFEINTSELKTRTSVLNEEDENKIDFSAIEQDDNVNNFEINTSELKTRASVLNEEDENKSDFSAIEQDDKVSEKKEETEENYGSTSIKAEIESEADLKILDEEEKRGIDPNPAVLEIGVSNLDMNETDESEWDILEDEFPEFDHE